MLQFRVAASFGGAVLVAFIGVVMLSVSRPERREKWLPGLLLSGLALVNALITAQGRVDFGPTGALESRYTTMSLLMWIGLSLPAIEANSRIWRWFRQRQSRAWGALAFVPILVAMFLYGSSYTYGIARLELRSARLRSIIPMLQHLDSLSEDDIVAIQWLYPDRDFLRAQVLQLKSWGYGPFKS